MAEDPIKKDWSNYYEITKNNPPSNLLVEAFKYVKNKGKAIDIGAGALKDTKYLLDKGFNVIALDASKLMETEAKKIKSDRFKYFISSFNEFNFPVNEFDLASAQFSIPFNPPETFNNVFKKIKKSLKKDGIFCGQLFGVRDEWSKNSNITFHTKEQVEKLLSDMEIIYFKEQESDDTTANGTPKHWHIFEFICKNKN